MDKLGLGSGKIGLRRKKKVKVEGASSLSWVNPLYVNNLLFARIG